MVFWKIKLISLFIFQIPHDLDSFFFFFFLLNKIDWNFFVDSSLFVIIKPVYVRRRLKMRFFSFNLHQSFQSIQKTK